MWSWFRLEALETSPVLFFCCAARTSGLRKVKKLAHAPAAAFILLQHERFIKGSKNTPRSKRVTSISLPCGDFPGKKLNVLIVTFLDRAHNSWVLQMEKILSAAPDCTNSMRTHKCIWQFHTCIHLSWCVCALCVLTERLARLVHALCQQGFMYHCGVTHKQRSGVRPEGDNFVLCSSEQRRPTGGWCGCIMETIVKHSNLATQNIVIFNLPHQNAGEVHNGKCEGAERWKTAHSTFTHPQAHRKIDWDTWSGKFC
jgi:hypothetical protein